MPTLSLLSVEVFNAFTQQSRRFRCPSKGCRLSKDWKDFGVKKITLTAKGNKRGLDEAVSDLQERGLETADGDTDEKMMLMETLKMLEEDVEEDLGGDPDEDSDEDLEEELRDGEEDLAEDLRGAGEELEYNNED